MITIIVILIVLMLLLMSREKNMAGYNIDIDDSSFDTTEYTESKDVIVNNDLMEKLVLATNKYVSDKTGLCTYVIETTSIKKYIHNENKNELYRCMFMLMKQHGFTFGFSVTVDIKSYPDGTVQVLNARTQPIDVKPPTNQGPFTSDVEGHEFTRYERFRESELELIKISKRTL